MSIATHCASQPVFLIHSCMIVRVSSYYCCPCMMHAWIMWPSCVDFSLPLFPPLDVGFLRLCSGPVDVCTLNLLSARSSPQLFESHLSVSCISIHANFVAAWCIIHLECFAGELLQTSDLWKFHLRKQNTFAKKFNNIRITWRSLSNSVVDWSDFSH